MNAYVIPFEQLGMHDVERVGGKNASLGEMIGALAKLGVRVPGGFATTAHAYREFLAQGGLAERIGQELAGLDVDDVSRLAASGARIRQWILATPLPPAFNGAVRGAGVELTLEWADEGREQIEEQPVGGDQHIAQIILYQSAEHDRPQPLLLRGAVDAPHRLVRLVKR